ncbi:diphthamide synthesis protein, putative [Plasmodium sp. gorilla clade G3]|nr:diphthamide synthesis protein, putative [Plasmodium sp. gorilla clade G3]
MNDIVERYELKLLINIILNNNYKNVAIQLPDCMLKDSLCITNFLKNEFQKYNKEIIFNESKKNNSNRENDNNGSINRNDSGCSSPYCCKEKKNEDNLYTNENKKNKWSNNKTDDYKVNIRSSVHVDIDNNNNNNNNNNNINNNNNNNNNNINNNNNNINNINNINNNNNNNNNHKHVNLYILGDTTLNECCEDYVSAEHVEADFLVHYGISCQSFIIPFIPSIYIFNKKKIEDNFFHNIKKYLKNENVLNQNKISILLCDASYVHVLPELVRCFFYKIEKNNNICTDLKNEEEKEINDFLSFCRYNNKIIYNVDEKIYANKTFYKKGEDNYNEYNRMDLKNDNNRNNNVYYDNNEDEDDIIFTNIIVCLYRIANNINGKVCYGFFNNYVDFDIKDKVEDKYLFMCGRLVFKVFYNMKKEMFFYKIVEKKKEEMQIYKQNGDYELLNNKNMNLFIFSSDNKNFINRCLLEYNNCNNIYIYDTKDIFIKDTRKIIDKVLLKRYSLIEKCKQVNNVGILISNVNLEKNKDIRILINYILRKNKKKCFTIVTNKLNTAKLENFYDIEIYILLTCPENNLLELKDFSKKIINPYEFFIAYNYVEWEGKYLFDFFELLNISSIKKEYQAIHNNKYFLWNIDKEFCSLKNHHKDNNDKKQNVIQQNNSILEKYDHLIDSNLSISIEDQKQFITRFDEKSQMCTYFLNLLKENHKREYKGVDMNYNIDHVPHIVKGLDGIAQKYDTDVKHLKNTDTN